MPAFGSGGGYDGPLAYRMGKPMRPDVAAAFDRMAAAARAEGGAVPVDQQRLHRTPSRQGCSPQTPTPSGWRRRARACTATPPSSTWGRPPPTPGSTPTPAASASSMVRLGALALRVRRQPARSRAPGSLRPGPHRSRRAATTAGSSTGSLVRAATLPRPDRAGGAPLERADERARSAAVRRVGLQPRAGPVGAEDRPVHARHGRRLRARQPVRPRGGDRRTGASHERSAAAVRRQGGAGAGGLQRRGRRGRGATAASRRLPRRARTSAGSWACWAGRAS